MRKICRALVLCMLLLAAFDTTIAGLIAAADKDHAETGTYYIVRDSRSSGGSRLPRRISAMPGGSRCWGLFSWRCCWGRCY